jgi:choline dehydrogenase-like flavoprotein
VAVKNRVSEVTLDPANQFDVIVIGSGAGGGTLTYALASTGKKILLLERGDYVPREKANWDRLEAPREAPQVPPPSGGQAQVVAPFGRACCATRKWRA